MPSERDVMPPQPDGIVPGDAGSASLPIDSREETALLDDLRVVIDRQATAEVRARTLPRKLEGTQIGRYAINRLIGEGGMASVYRAVDLDNRRDVAIKILKPQYQADRDVLARFEREARSIASIRHENVVQIFSFLREDDVCAIVMELLTGGNLRRRLDSSQGALPAVSIAEAVTLITQAARGVGAAHEKGIVHRDIKPSNLLFDRDRRVKVADFGVTFAMEQTTWLTGVGQRIGTPAYMSPEQCRGDRVTPASDVYSLGATLFEILTGRLPFAADEASPFAMMLKHISEPAPDPRRWREDVPAWLTSVLLKSLEKEPGARFATGNEFAVALSVGAEIGLKEVDRGEIGARGWRMDLDAVRRQLLQLPQRAIVCWACRCARRVHDLNPDPRVNAALAMAEATVTAAEPTEPGTSLSSALSRIRNLRVASLKAAYSGTDRGSSRAGAEAARAAAAAAACAAARCIDDAAADAAFAARSAVAALAHAGKPIREFWESSRRDYKRLRAATLGQEGTIGRPISSDLFGDA